jgi:predicted amidophosphoribosyltransferase
MIDVVCFCGCWYAFDGDTGACPQCGEPVTFHRSPAGQQQKVPEPERLEPSVGDGSGDELAA